MIDHVLLLMAMGVAAAGVLAHSLTGWRSRDIRYLHAGTWYVLFLAVLVLTRAEPWGPFPNISIAVDFGGAAALHVSLAVYLAASGALKEVPGVAESPRPSAGATAMHSVVLMIAWACWFVALDGQITSYTLELLTNAAALGLGGAVAGLIAGGMRGLGLTRMLEGTVAGLAAGSAAAASVSSLAAASLGVIAGVLAVILPRAGRANLSQVPELVLAAGIGGTVGLLGVGLLDQRAGFLMAGQPQLLLTQVAVSAGTACVTVVISLALARAFGNAEEPPA